MSVIPKHHLSGPQVVRVLPKPYSGLAPIRSSSALMPIAPVGTNSAVMPIGQVYTKKEQSNAKKRADLTETIFNKKEQLKKLLVSFF